MSAIDFPDSPSVNDTFTYDDNTWQWTGQFWELLPFEVQGIQGTQGIQGLPGLGGYSFNLLFF